MGFCFHIIILYIDIFVFYSFIYFYSYGWCDNRMIFTDPIYVNVNVNVNDSREMT